jgi:FKBP-type peptidyl-prolyl cis-trans isomerase SlyD
MSHTYSNDDQNGKVKITDNMVVSLDYTLRLEDGEVVDSSAEHDPLEFLQGAGEIIPGLEQALYGMAVGEKKEVVVPPEDAYGDLDPEAYQMVPRELFPADLVLEEGMELNLIDTETDEPIEAFVSEILPEGIVLDFNHPLAGETLFFHVKVADVRPATAEEISHGHVHNGHEN